MLLNRRVVIPLIAVALTLAAAAQPAHGQQLPEPPPEPTHWESVAAEELSRGEGTPDVDAPRRERSHAGVGLHSGRSSHYTTAYELRALELSQRSHAPASQVPAGFEPWWQRSVMQRLQGDVEGEPVSVHSLVYGALKHSAFVRGISKIPLISETSIVEAHAQFDPTAFVESKFQDLSEPVGNTLTTGGPNRLRDHDWDHSAGLRRRTQTGGTFEVAQQIGYQDTNSTFFAPTQQGTSRIALSFNQPLLRGRGKAYNRALIVLAQIDTRVGWDEMSEQLQGHLLKVTEAYWRLYLGRASLLQKERHHKRAEGVLQALQGRREIDALESQIALAHAAVETRNATLARAATNVRNAEARIRALGTLAAPRVRPELIPAEVPSRTPFPVDLSQAMLTALQHRPEVDEALAEIHAACVRRNMAKHELLPIFNVAVETYVSGLAGSSDIGRAWVNQFTEGEPSYSIGLQLELPLHNRAAAARMRRRTLEVAQVVDQFHAKMEMLMAEVETAVREVDTSYRELSGNYRAMQAASTELTYYQRRWRLLPGEDRSTSFLLEDLLSSQDRLATAEFAYSQAEVNYMMSLSNLNRATGNLLEREQVSMTRSKARGQWELGFDAPAELSQP